MKQVSILCVFCLSLLWTTAQAHAAFSFHTSTSSMRGTMFAPHESEFGTLRQAMSEETANRLGQVSLGGLIVGLTALVPLAGSAFTLHRQRIGTISPQDKSPLGWGVSSILVGTANLAYSAFLLIAASPLTWVMAATLVAVGATTLGLGIANIVRYNELQTRKYLFNNLPFRYDMSLRMTSVHLTIHFS